MLQPERFHKASNADALAVDALFRRLAERGRKIRNKNRAADNNKLDKKTLSGELDSSVTKAEAKHD